MLYRKFVGILSGGENQQGYGCINGINTALPGVMRYISSGQDARTTRVS
ncbi:hypothetical protein H6F39_11455 [Anabaena sp. FACHB-1250]|nr:hypothetical protein [Anabaena sp. FACHB-1250]MBD2141968.1 hypothetical protein [Anabaena sp. FACHB-1250]